MLELGSPARGLSPPTDVVAQSTPIEHESSSPVLPLSESPIVNNSARPKTPLSRTTFSSVSSTSNDCVYPHPSPPVKIRLFSDGLERSPGDNKEAMDYSEKVRVYMYNGVCIIPSYT